MYEVHCGSIVVLCDTAVEAVQLVEQLNVVRCVSNVNSKGESEGATKHDT